jgi:hypothetical protein
LLGLRRPVAAQEAAVTSLTLLKAVRALDVLLAAVVLIAFS